MIHNRITEPVQKRLLAPQPDLSRISFDVQKRIFACHIKNACRETGAKTEGEKMKGMDQKAAGRQVQDDADSIIASKRGTQELAVSQLNETFPGIKKRHLGRNRRSRLVGLIEFRYRDGSCASASAWRCIWKDKRKRGQPSDLFLSII